MLDLVGNQDCWFSHAMAQVSRRAIFGCEMSVGRPENVPVHVIQ